METTLTLLVLTAVITIGVSQTIPRCLLSRLDRVPCKDDSRIKKASKDNEFSIHYTKMEGDGAGGVECRMKRKNQKRKTITTIGTENTKIINSPGFLLGKRYDNQLLGQYNIRCEEGRLAFFNVTEIDMQGSQDCLENGKQRCQDYILIDRGMGGTTEICGNSSSDDSVLELQSPEFTVFFRTSEEKKFRGFQMYIICFREADRDRRGCLTPMDFNSTVCQTGSGNGELRPLKNTRDECRERTRRDTYADITYKDIFPEYPSGLRMRKDVANFHNLWRRKKRQAGEDIRFVKKIVFYNESVNYTDSTIRITDTDGTVTGLYGGVQVLQTFDAFGEIDTYVFRVIGPRAEIYPHFKGPGPLTIIGRSAYFQLFLIDPRGLIPTEEEAVELRQMNEQLFNSIPESEDFELNDTTLTMEDFSALGIGRKKRDVSEKLLPDEIPNVRARRQLSNEIEFSNKTLFLALRNREACTPAVRQQAISLIELLANSSEADVQELQNFTINCTVVEKELQCKVDECFAPALDMGTFCTVNGKPPIECDPFYDRFTSCENITNVTVEAINCNGQRATMTFPSS